MSRGPRAARSGDAGELALVLHTHLPYLRNHGVWPVGEEWLFQAWGESWLPLTMLLLRLADEGFTDVLTLGVTPMVAHQVADQRLANDLGTWLGIQMWRSEEQRTLHDPLTVQRHTPEQRSLHDWIGPEIPSLGPFYWQHYARLLDAHEHIQSRGGLLAVWSDLASRGVIELLGGPATHPYLPLQPDPELIDAQLACGLADHAGWADRPSGLWAPEMGYRPRGQVADATARPRRVDRHGTPTLPRTGPELPGLEEHYAQHGIDHFLVDAATLVRAAGGRDRDWTTRPDVPDPDAHDPYEVVHDGVLVSDSDVVAFARDLSVAYHVWSPTAGYPGNGWYRDYHVKGAFGCHPSWRVTDRSLPAEKKLPYDPERANAQARHDAEHLHGVLRDVLDPRPGELVVAAYDTELFGHWWFEGVTWLEALLRRVATDPALRTTTLRSRIDRRPPVRRLDLPESSWGYAKGHASWVTPETRPMWIGLQRATERARATLSSGSGPEEARQQIARELALLQSSDWPFMVTRGNAEGYAFERFDGHLTRLEELCDLVDAGDLDGAAWRAGELRDLDDAPTDPSPIVATLSAPSSPGRLQTTSRRSVSQIPASPNTTT